MSTLRRLTFNSAANGYGILANVCVQLITVPTLLWAWGIGGFGTWTLMATLPAFLALSDLGFTDAACSEMSMRAARHDREGARMVFQTAAALLILISIGIISFSFIFIMIFKESILSPHWFKENSFVIFSLIIHASLAMLSRIPLLAMRATGNYSKGTFVYETMVLIEGISVIAVAFLGGGFRGAVMALIVMRVLNMLILTPLLFRLVPWLKESPLLISRLEARYLLPRAFGALAIPSVTAIQMQISVLIIGATLSPAAAAIFVPLRTISRILVTLVYGLSNATIPEISTAAGSGDQNRLNELVLINFLFISLILIPGGLLLSIVARPLIDFWTGGKIIVPTLLSVYMSLAMIVHGTWNIISRMLLAISKHAKLALTLFFFSIFSIPLITYGATSLGLAGVALSILLMETIFLASAIVFFRENFEFRKQLIINFIFNFKRYINNKINCALRR